jgi:hypothetical protein
MDRRQPPVRTPLTRVRQSENVLGIVRHEGNPHGIVSPVAGHEEVVLRRVLHVAPLSVGRLVHEPSDLCADRPRAKGQPTRQGHLSRIGRFRWIGPAKALAPRSRHAKRHAATWMAESRCPVAIATRAILSSGISTPGVVGRKHGEGLLKQISQIRRCVTHTGTRCGCPSRPASHMRRITSARPTIACRAEADADHIG